MIQEKIQTLSTCFQDTTNITLFGELPLKEISRLEELVSNEDSMRTRLQDICNIFDRINKKELDKLYSNKSIGSKACLINTLKYFFKSEHDFINELELKLDYLFLIRDYYTHGKHKHIKKASEFLNIDFSKDEVSLIWEKVLKLFEDFLVNTINLFENKVKLLQQEKVNEDIKDFISLLLMEKIKSKIDEPEIKKYITNLLLSKPQIDSKFAENFDISVEQLHNDLWYLYPEILNIEYFDNENTLISIREEIKDLLIDYYRGTL